MLELTKLSDYNSPDFHAQLRLIPSKLPVKSTNEFFKQLFGLFSEDFPEIKGAEILNAATRTICSPDHLKEFLKGSFNSELPFSDPVYYPNILNILNEYAVRAPDTFDDYLISQFSKIISYDETKSLTILALFLKNIEKENSSSQKMEELLFSYSNIFLKQGIFQDYISLLIYLCNTNKTFEKENGKKCWQTLCEVLKSQYKNLYIDTYNALCSLYDINSSYIFTNEIPYNTVTEHINYTDLENVVISLLNRIVKSEKAILNKEDAEFSLTDEQKIKLIDSLVKISKNNENATLLLCYFAENNNYAKHLVEISHEWLADAIPTYENTVKLFCVVLIHQNLRDELANKREIVPLFDNMLKAKRPIIIDSIPHIIRHINITETLIDKLCSEIDFFRRYFSLIKKMNSDALYISSFLLADVISRQKYISELDTVCELICSVVTEYSENSENLINSNNNDNKIKNNKITAAVTGIKVAIILSQHYNCASAFKKMDFHTILKREMKKQDEQIKKDAKICLQVMKKTMRHQPNSNEILIQEEEEDV
ncbi:hypothetical protein M9Y10_012574 [Tritrichomonas musculus]|uniref:Uncharacterized protein n=1 Tax=Tritrichomonas musculus TaxID=1915356 RepID=A0ABR2ICU4_9EUKA